MLEFGLIIITSVLFFLGVIWLVDQVFNGVVKEWFLNIFVLEPEYPSRGMVGILFRSWFEVKQFFINTFLVVLIILTTCMCASAYFYERYRSKKEITFIKNTMVSIMNSNSDSITLPAKYSEIETQLIKLKSITQRQQQLVQTEMQRKNDLITYLAHDLKTPLASVIGYLSLLDEVPEMPVEQKSKYVSISLEKAYRLEELINEFFEITRFNLQSIVLNKGKIKLAFMLQQLADEFYPMLEPQGKQVAIDVPDELNLVGDADKLARVFNNILKNAIVYSYESSVIDISATNDGENITVAFINQGEPIPAPNLDTIFDKFYRLDSARSTNTGGAGLGLAIAKEIITAHNGTITAESNLDHTIFTVKIPV
ncbi:two-component system, OmpR family, sensor histidine kinase VanS [Anoxynatronum buryatiense]|uniref:histidine kinase n=2 Tax=Anoxynatronum buryatiense TaxID=489973 RepID=A0AA45WVZ3_9CLOT|nr:two-component system, OmpR family, sensor histidine kinase VanS [Anoxynatronum buryatiense]